MRSYFEELELRFLAPYAVKSVESRGRVHDEPTSETRTCFQRDRDRIIHSKAFRRLKHKTQVFIATESDHYRSRLTHTIEVAQISRHVARMLRLNEDLSESIALAHDLGHTPFGHSGEKILNRLMANFGGFEHNLQSRRVIDSLEIKYPLFPGLNLSFEVREGLMKHSTPWDHPEQDAKTWTSLEAQVCNISDEIAYNNHDIDDGIRSTLLDEHDLTTHVYLWRESKDRIRKKYAGLADIELKYLINSDIISTQIEDVVRTTTDIVAALELHCIDDIQSLDRPVVRFSTEMALKNKEMRHYLFQQFYSHPTIYRMNKKGQEIIEKLFTAFTSDTKLLPLDYQDRIEKGQEHHRVVADYIAGMTDPFAKKEFGAIFQ